MEGKAYCLSVLEIDSIDVEVDTEDTESFIETVRIFLKPLVVLILKILKHRMF